jgi:hypothetical protein
MHLQGYSLVFLEAQLLNKTKILGEETEVNLHIKTELYQLRLRDLIL